MNHRKRKGDKRSIDPSSKVKRSLFGRPDEEELEAERKRKQEETRRSLNEMRLKYNYDPVTGTPLQLPNALYEWQNIEQSHRDDSSNSRRQHGAGTETESTPSPNDSFDRTTVKEKSVESNSPRQDDAGTETESTPSPNYSFDRTTVKESSDETKQDGAGTETESTPSPNDSFDKATVKERSREWDKRSETDKLDVETTPRKS